MMWPVSDRATSGHGQRPARASSATFRFQQRRNLKVALQEIGNNYFLLKAGAAGYYYRFNLSIF
jgi:hypothetical protein